VTVHKDQPSTPSDLALTTTTTTTTTSSSTSSSKTDSPDLTRVKDLMLLHHSVKTAHERSGLDDELRRAREDVNRVLLDLQRK
jgi:hypothetical protein